LQKTRAAAVVLRAADAKNCPVAALLSDNPYATYARMAAVICPVSMASPGVHVSAVIAQSATVDSSAHIAANVVIGEGSRIGEHVQLGAGCVVGPDCVVGKNCTIDANVTLVRKVLLGECVRIHSGAVIGADGFGNAMTDEGWIKVPQLGGVRIGDDVEIGANSTIDCGALGDTVIENGVRIDNLCMIAHNVRIGEHTAMAAMTGIAGSAVIGKRCLFAGKSGTVGHITVCDDVVVAAKTFLSKDVTVPGTYAASFPAAEARTWARQLARFRRLGALFERVKKLEK
jgi:UDP-3-O-[3-hydroxymyristoyl] glucosamine N-acyltransferase